MQGRAWMLWHFKNKQTKQDIFIKSSLVHQRLAQTIWNVESKPNEHINKLILKIGINQAC